MTLQAYAWCALGGVLYFLSFLNFDLFPLTWICFVPVLLAIRTATPLQALRLGAAFGFITNAGGFYWIVHLLAEFGHLHIIVAALGFALICLYQGFLLALALAFVRLAERDLKIAPVWSLPIVLPALELIYPLLFPSFIGNSQYEFSAVTQIVDVTGMLGLTALIALINGALYELVNARMNSRRIERTRLFVPIGTLALCVAYGLLRLPVVAERTAHAPTLKVALIQVNVGGVEKREDVEEFYRLHERMSAAAVAAQPQIDLIVWPESAYGRFINRADRKISDAGLTAIGKPVLFGVLTYDDPDNDGVADVYNSVMLTSPDGDVLDMFDKIKLLAFGETIPFADTFPALYKLFGMSGGFARGKSQHSLRLGELSLLPMICYEDIIPSFVRSMWKHGGPATALVNVTNDSWYGDTHEPMIHLVLASFRSIETRRALVRSTNTGISAIVDPTGRITQRTSQWKRETLVADVPLIKDGSTTLYMIIGDVLGWLAVALSVAILIQARRMKRRAQALPKP
jgi:apolipoprotein N-acyltransferase